MQVNHIIHKRCTVDFKVARMYYNSRGSMERYRAGIGNRMVYVNKFYLKTSHLNPFTRVNHIELSRVIKAVFL